MHLAKLNNGKLVHWWPEPPHATPARSADNKRLARQPEYRIEMRLALVRATKGFLDDMKAAKS